MLSATKSKLQSNYKVAEGQMSTLFAILHDWTVFQKWRILPVLPQKMLHKQSKQNWIWFHSNRDRKRFGQLEGTHGWIRIGTYLTQEHKELLRRPKASQQALKGWTDCCTPNFLDVNERHGDYNAYHDCSLWSVTQQKLCPPFPNHALKLSWDSGSLPRSTSKSTEAKEGPSQYFI